MVKAAAAALATVCALAAVATAGAVPGKLKARKTASGAFAVTALTATVEHPRGLWLRLLGNVQSSSTVIACTRGSSLSSNSYLHGGSGTYAIPVKPAGAQSCQVVASVGGSGRVTVELWAR